MRSLILPLMLVSATALARPPATLEVSSPAFSNNQPIPAEYTCEGASTPPPLAWSNVPASTKSLAILIDDPDAPSGTFTHWLVTNIPAGTTTLQKTLPTGAMTANNSNGNAGYFAPCPPSGTHRYRFDVFALDIAHVKAQSRAAFLAEIHGHVVGKGELIGTYQKQR